MTEITRSDWSRFCGKIAVGDGCWGWAGAIRPDGYGYFWLHGSMKLAHRVAYELFVGEIDDGQEIDHRCFTRGCVNPGHLRAVSHKQNNEHLQGAQSNSSTGFRGVYWRKHVQSYSAEVTHHGEVHHVGWFDSAEEASKAVTIARNALFTHNDVDRAPSLAPTQSVIGVRAMEFPAVRVRPGRATGSPKRQSLNKSLVAQYGAAGAGES